MKRHPPHSPRRRRRSRGQILMVVVVMLVALLIFGFFLFDLQGVIRLRGRSQTGVDAAALAGAAWQGRTLNMIGELNLLKATTVMLTDPQDPSTPVDVAHTELMTQLQARLTYAGPLMGVAAAQQAARQNGLRSDGSYTGQMWERMVNLDEEAGYYEDLYGSADPGNFGFSWQPLYSTLLFDICHDGIAANPTNPRPLRGAPRLSGAGSGLLIDPEFYRAVYACDYCWFYRRGIGPDHGTIDLPNITYVRNQNAYFVGSEYLSVYVEFEDSRDPAQLTGVSDLHAARGQQALSAGQPRIEDVRWAVYNADWNETSNYDFVNRYLRSSFRTEYTYGGACARFITHAHPGYISHDKSWKYGQSTYASGTVESTAAAKPFGKVNSATPQSVGMVLPVFTETRLIPVALVTASVFSEKPDFYEFIIDYFGNPDYPDVPADVAARYNNYLNAVRIYNDPDSSFNQAWLRFDEWRTASKAQTGRDPCESYPPSGGGGGGSSGGPGSLH